MIGPSAVHRAGRIPLQHDDDPLWFRNFLAMMELGQQSETVLVYTIGAVTVLLRNSLLQGVGNTMRKWELFSLDFCCVVVPMFLAQSFFASFLPLFLLVLLGLSALAFSCCGARAGMTPLRALRPLRVDSARAQRDAHTMFRALLLLTTALAILAVDFTLFPRRMAKTSHYGHSLMDTGTGAFIFVNALADADAAARGQQPRQRAARATMQIPGLPFRVPTLLALFLIGVGRSAFIHFSGYGQDVAEYGVHWNFFLTLFFVRVFVLAVPPGALIPTGLLLGSIYQFLLSHAGLEPWILRDELGSPRHGLLDQNREGICSLAGYCFIYSASLVYARWSARVMARDKKLSPVGVGAGFAFSLACFGVQLLFEHPLDMLASRRVANLPYAFAMLALCSGTCSLMLLAQLIQPMAPNSTAKGGLVEAVSRNALLHFLVANLMTGGMNLVAMPLFHLHGRVWAETAAMLAYALASSLLIYAIHLSKGR